jgi:cytochrome c biogenesis protein CcmG/thiol:disulfide interchange protein DsbE
LRSRTSAAYSRMAVLTLFVLVFGAGCNTAEKLLTLAQERSSTGSGPGVGNPAGTFAFDTFSGQRVDLDQLRGKPIVLNFWASWCVPCRAEMPGFEQAYRRLSQEGVAFVGLAVQDDPQAAREFVHALGISYPTGIDYRNAASMEYQLVGLPTTVLIASDGKVARRWNGPVNTDQLIEAVKGTRS